MVKITRTRLRWFLGIGLLASSFYGALSFWKYLTLTCACGAAPITEAKMYLGAMSRAQQWEYQEKGAFTPDWMAMEPLLGMSDESDHYRYSLQMTEGVLYGVAIAKEPTLHRHAVTAMVPTEEVTSPEMHLTHRSFVLCLSDQPGDASIPLPTYEDSEFGCAPGTVDAHH